MTEKKRLCILLPVYNDWKSLSLLIDDFYKHLLTSFDKVKVLIVNDGSVDSSPVSFRAGEIELEILHLRRNVGHQKAIAIGISYLAQQQSHDVVVVMDGDGEDRVVDIPLLLKEHERKPESIVFAKRRKRKKSPSFIVLYFLYRLIFRILTGRFISFGNFCLIPAARIQTLAHLSETWNHFSGAIIRSGIPYTTVSLDRGKRTAGKSKMDLTALVIHGIGSISVYLDVVSIRLLFFFGLMILISFLGIIVVVSLRVYTDLAIPGWASTVGIGLILIILQSFFILLVLSFIVLIYRSQTLFIPALRYKDFVLKVEAI
jgi:glycosyltransferase involved in cell wall biosynthesis